MPIPPTKLSFNYLLDPKGMSYGRYDTFLSSRPLSDFLLHSLSVCACLSLSLSLLIPLSLPLYLHIYHNIHFLSIIFPFGNVHIFLCIPRLYIYLDSFYLLSDTISLKPLFKGDTMSCTMNRQTVWQ